MQQTETLKKSSYKPSEFPIEECIDNCYLKKMSYKEGYDDDGVGFQKVCFSFMNGEDWIHLILKNPRKGYYDEEEEFIKEKTRVITMFENIQSVYLDPKVMKKLLLDNTGFRSWIKEMREEMKNVRFWDTEVELKTLPRKGGGTTLPRYAPFIRKKGDINIRLKYSNWESGLFNN